MRQEVRVEHLGDGVESAVFAAWLVGVGDQVAAGDIVAEVMTDKVNLEIEAPSAGTIESLECEPDQDVRPGQVIGYLMTSE